MNTNEFITELKSRINPAYADQLGTESYERRQCVEVIEGLVKHRDELLAALECHQEQTRPIQRTIDVIASVKGQS